MNPPIEQNNNEDLNLLQRQEGNDYLKSIDKTNEMQLELGAEANSKLDDINRTLELQLEQGNKEVQKVKLVQEDVEDDEDKLANTFYKMLRGKKGEKGDKGDKGDTGDKGDKGDPGEDAYTPIKGRDYFDGEKGEKGDVGPQGPQGVQGFPGKDGKDGKDGANADIKEIKKLIPKPETTETILEKIKDKFSFTDLKDIPMYLRKVASKTMSLFELDDTNISNPTNDQVLKYNSTTGKWENGTSSSGGTPGGSTTQLQYNNAGSFGGISGATTNGTAVTYSAGNLIAGDVTASGSGGLLLQANNGTDVALLGAGGGSGATFYGGVNIAGELTVDTNTLYVDATNNRVGLLTTAPTHTLTLGSTSTGIALYNTADQTTNYERLRMYWTSNVSYLNQESAGSGSNRSLVVRSTATSGTTADITFNRAATSHMIAASAVSSTGETTFRVVPAMTGTSTIPIGLAVAPTINQSSTAGYTALLVNPTETTTGSGSKLLADFQVGGVSKFSVTNAAVTTISNTSGQTFTFSPVLGGANYPGVELLTTAGNGSFFRANTTSGVQLDMLSNAAVSGIIRTNNSYPLELRTNNTVGLTISTAQVGTFANNSIITANAITATGNAATIPITKGRNIVTNNSAATLTITLTTGAVNMQTVIVQILDFSAVAQTITWVNTENSTVTAPTTSNGSTTLPLTVGFIYNSATSKWRCIASA